MNLLVWLVIGACTGSLIAMTMRQGLGLLANVALGIAGAVIGGTLGAHGDVASSPLTIATFSMSLIGAIAVLSIATALRTSVLR